MLRNEWIYNVASQLAKEVLNLTQAWLFRAPQNWGGEGKFLLAIIFLFFQIFIFGPVGPFFPKDLGHPKELKNGTIMLKFGTLVDWMNTWGFIFIFSKSSFLGPWDPFLKFTTLYTACSEKSAQPYLDCQ